MSYRRQRADQRDLQKILLQIALCATYQDARGEDERTAEDDLHRRHEEAHVEVAVADKGDGEQLEANDPKSYVERQIDVRYEERQGVQDAAYERGEARNRTPQERTTPPGERSIVRKPLREAHANPCPHGGRKTDQKRDPRVPRSKSRRKQRRQRRNRSVHQTHEAGLHNSQYEVLAVSRGRHLPAPKSQSL